VVFAISYLAFVVNSLDGATFWPWFRPIYRGLLVLGAMAFLINSFSTSFDLLVLISQVYGFVVMVATLIVITGGVTNRFPTSGYLLVAEIVALAGVGSFMLMMQEVLPAHQLTIYGMHWGILGEALLLSFALAAHTRIAQEQSFANLKRYQLLYENSTKGLFDYDIQRNELKCNKTFAKVFGYAELENLPKTGNPLLSFFPEYQGVLRGTLFQTGIVKDYEVIVNVRETQTQVWVAVTMRLVRDHTNKPIRIEGSMVDISERKLKEATQQSYKKLYNLSPQGLFTYAFKDRSFTCNNALARVFDFSDAEALIASNTPVAQFNEFTESYSNEELFSLLKQNGKVQHIETPIGSDKNNPQNKLAQRKWASISMELKRDADGKPESIEGSCIDITERKLREAAEKEKLLVASHNRAKIQFFASMSHELRTPLTSILGYSEAASSEEVKPSFIKNALGRIHHSGKQLLQTINDILDLSKLEAQKFDMERIQVYLYPLLEEIKDTIDPLSFEKGLDFSINYQVPLPKIFSSDPTRVKQVLLNLCSNAIKYTETGSVTLNVSCNTEQQLLIFEVEDNGVGLTAEQSATLFDVFSETNTVTTRNYNDTGLSLYLAKQLANKLGGDITVSSVYGEGSRFTFTAATDCLKNTEWLEHSPTEGTTTRSTVIPQLSGHLLYAEDNEMNQLLIKTIVEATGVQISVASNGKKALEMYDQHHFDLVFTDVRMPIMDGLELTKLLLEKNPQLPVVAITATLMDVELVELKAMGFKTVLRKPIDRKMIYTVMQQILSAKSQLPNEVADKKLNCPRVLVAEDNPDNQTLITVYLKKAQAEVVIVDNGAEALARALDEAFDLVLMDMQMPVMDGMTAVRALRNKGYEKPIYALTANDNPDAIRECMAAGCNGHLNKPLETAKLMAVIQGLAINGMEQTNGE